MERFLIVRPRERAGCAGRPAIGAVDFDAPDGSVVGTSNFELRFAMRPLLSKDTDTAHLGTRGHGQRGHDKTAALRQGHTGRAFADSPRPSAPPRRQAWGVARG